MTDIWLKITGTRKQVRDAFRALGMESEMLTRDGSGLRGYSHDVAINFISDLITKFATHEIDAAGKQVELTPAVFAGPHLMIRFVSARAKRKARQKIVQAGGLPPGLERVPAPTTIEWAGG